MIIDAPKEINAHENRIALTLQTALELTLYSQDVLIDKTAGEFSGFSILIC